MDLPHPEPAGSVSLLMEGRVRLPRPTCFRTITSAKSFPFSRRPRLLLPNLRKPSRSPPRFCLPHRLVVRVMHPQTPRPLRLSQCNLVCPACPRCHLLQTTASRCHLGKRSVLPIHFLLSGACRRSRRRNTRQRSLLSRSMLSGKVCFSLPIASPLKAYGLANKRRKKSHEQKSKPTLTVR